jgi:parvulin-like peptidyl-prolyl isomerase
MARIPTLAVAVPTIAFAGWLAFQSWSGSGSRRALVAARAPEIEALDAGATSDADASSGLDRLAEGAGSGAMAQGGSGLEGLDALALDAGLAPSTLAPPVGLGAIPDKSLRSVRAGVVLVTYQGAEGAPGNARSKDAARALAAELAGEARTDFRRAVSRGDPGSAEDIGRIPRGVLEAHAEYALFTLDRGGVSDPVETPRGFWIVKRLD